MGTLIHLLGLACMPMLAAILGATQMQDIYDVWKPAALPAILATAWFLFGLFGLIGYHGDQGGFILLIPIYGAVAVGLCMIIGIIAWKVRAWLSPRKQ